MALLRLLGAGWVLVRADALLPREAQGLMPAPLVALGKILRLLAGPQSRRGRPGERLAKALEGLGPVAIKLGQLLSTRADILGTDFADDLSRLKDQLQPFDTQLATAVVQAGIDRPITDLFVEFGPAVAAASIAQAHRAVLADGRVVAVKVLRPGIEQDVAKDVAVLTLAADLAHRLVPLSRRLAPRDLAATVSRSLTLELDLRLEAAGADELGEVMAQDGWMSAPKVVWEGVGKRFLTLTWADGQPLSSTQSLEQPGLDRPALANALMRGFLAQALDHGVFHADLHEGNLFVGPPSAIVAVDYGIMGRIGPDERRYLAEILWGFLRRDYRRVAEIHFEAGYVPAVHSIDAFAQALRAVGQPIFGRSAKDVSMGRLLGQLFEITALFDMHLRPELVLLQKTMVTVEGVARRIDPDHDIWAAAEPVVRRWIARELSPTEKVKSLVQDAIGAIQSLARLAEAERKTQPTSPPAPASGIDPFWLALSVSTALTLAAILLFKSRYG
ncbi:MAG: 2-polyprenylphenol 6-hydroxylase [Pseudomonadota bacterium]|jgi:ubiquinone biosynthesis protein